MVVAVVVGEIKRKCLTFIDILNEVRAETCQTAKLKAKMTRKLCGEVVPQAAAVGVCNVTTESNGVLT